jgi:protein-S-isoprenylcysteine O-methyltransferase Ste14
MWFYIVLAALAILFVVWVTRSNLFHHWRAHRNDPGQKSVSAGGHAVYGQGSSSPQIGGRDDGTFG